jgi:hypothetical protein
LKKQPDGASRDAVLSAFFENLAKDKPSLRHFSNRALFEDIINHRFQLGNTYDSCHKGFSPLAFLPKTHAAIDEEEMVAEDHYHKANVKTVAEVRKHCTKGRHRPSPLMMPNSSGSTHAT